MGEMFNIEEPYLVHIDLTEEIKKHCQETKQLIIRLLEEMNNRKKEELISYEDKTLSKTRLSQLIHDLEIIEDTRGIE